MIPIIISRRQLLIAVVSASVLSASATAWLMPRKTNGIVTYYEGERYTLVSEQDNTRLYVARNVDRSILETVARELRTRQRDGTWKSEPLP
jgi:hypothetical protein